MNRAGRVEGVANAVLFLAPDEASYSPAPNSESTAAISPDDPPEAQVEPATAVSAAATGFAAELQRGVGVDRCRHQIAEALLH
jgi:hypothetical protein